jgi:glycosyltransferase involved in cell wall biosynthesis
MEALVRIAQVAPLIESVPPKLYGGTERVVSWLTDALVAEGHDVTLFATGDSTTRAKLEPMSEQGLRLSGIRDHYAYHLLMLEHVRARADEFDVLHFHTDVLQFSMFSDIAHKCVTTMHGRLDLPDFMPIYAKFPEMPLISISKSQRKPLPPTTNWLATIPHGLPPALYPYSAGPGSYLAFLGRISAEKRVDRAIEIAIKAGMPIKIAAKIDPADRAYYEAEIKPLLDHPLVEFIDEIGDDRKGAFLGGAAALLFPIDWPEPFGLVMIEAMSTGTPVIAWREGSVPEVIEDGRSGFILSSIDEAVEAVARIDRLPRAGVRRAFEDRFTVQRMARLHVAAYQKLIASARGVGVADRALGLLRDATASPLVEGLLIGGGLAMPERGRACAFPST